MSCWIASDKHIASVVVAMCRAEERQKIADELKRENIRSYNYRYRTREKFEPCDLSQGEPISTEDAVMLTLSLEYQSCERPDWKKSKAFIHLHEILRDAAYPIVRSKGAWCI